MPSAEEPEGGRHRNWPRINARRLLQLRLGTALSREDFAKSCGVSARQLALWEENHGMPIQLSSFKKLAKGCSCDPRELMLTEEPPHLVTTVADLIATNIAIVAEAQDFLYVTGSRSRDMDYLNAIVRRLEEVPTLIHRRVLFGPPRTSEMRAHIEALLAIAAQAAKWVTGVERMIIGMYEDDRNFPPEAAICMNERRALIVLPSVEGNWTYNTAVVFEQQSVVRGWKNWIDSICAAVDAIGSAADIPPVRDAAPKANRQ